MANLAALLGSLSEPEDDGDDIPSPPSWERLSAIAGLNQDDSDEEDLIRAHTHIRTQSAPGFMNLSLQEELDLAAKEQSENNTEEDFTQQILERCGEKSGSCGKVCEYPRTWTKEDEAIFAFNSVTAFCVHKAFDNERNGQSSEDCLSENESSSKFKILSVPSNDSGKGDSLKSTSSITRGSSKKGKFYDSIDSMTDTKLLWRVAPETSRDGQIQGQRLRTPSDRDGESVYDSVSSTSSSAPLLRKITQGNDDGTDSQDGGASTCSMDNMGKSLLEKTLEKVKKSLGDLAPSPEAELFHQVMGTSNVHKVSRVYLKNLVVLSISFMVLYTSFFSLRNLQSSVNQVDGLGLAGLSCLSGSFIVFCFAAPSVVHQIRPKYALVASMFGHLVYVLANFYPSFYTIIPASILLGSSMSCLWVAQGTYLTSIAVTYATMTGKKHDGIIGLFNGFFLFCLQVAQILGNLISSFVFNLPFPATPPNPLHSNSPPREVPIFLEFDPSDFEMNPIVDEQSNLNMSSLDPPTPFEYCGFTYCHAYIIDHIRYKVGNMTLYVLLGVFACFTLIAIGTASLFLDKLDVIFQKSTSGLKQQFLILTNLHKEHKVWLLAMMLIFLGMEQAYIFGEVTKAYVTCPLGIHMIGYVMVCFGICDSLASFICGQLQRFVNTRVFMTIGAVLHLSLLTVALLWQPDNSKPYLVFLFVGGLGVADAIWQTQICNLMGCLYTKDHEAAFASLRMYEGIGYTVAFAYAQFLCMDVKTYILIGVLGVGMVNYYVLEYLEGRPKDSMSTALAVDV